MQIFVLTHLKLEDHIWICLFVPVTSNGFKLITTAQNNLRLNRKAKMFYSLSPPHYKIRWAHCQWYLALCSADSLQSVIVTKLWPCSMFRVKQGTPFPATPWQPLWWRPSSDTCDSIILSTTQSICRQSQSTQTAHVISMRSICPLSVHLTLRLNPNVDPLDLRTELPQASVVRSGRRLQGHWHTGLNACWLPLQPVLF